MSVVNGLSSAIAVSGAATVISSMVGIIARRVRIKSELGSVSEQKLDKSIETLDFESLGTYIWETLGNARVSDVASNRKLDSQFDLAASQLATFVGPQEPADSGSDESTVADNFSRDETYPEVFANDQELSRIYDDLNAGEVWVGMTRLRRHIEVQLATHPRTGSTSKFRSAGQIARQLAREGALNDNQLTGLLYAIQICNQAVHGAHIEHDVALDALFMAMRVLREIGDD